MGRDKESPGKAMDQEKHDDAPFWEVYKKKRQRVEFRTLLVLILSFSVIFFLSLQFRASRRSSIDVPDVPPGSGIIDSLYYNRPFLFTLKSPHSSWNFEIIGTDTTVRAADSSAGLWEQIRWLVRLLPVEDPVATNARTGILFWPGDVDESNLALTLLSELLHMHETGGQKVQIRVPVGGPAHHVLGGEYFMVLIPGPDESSVHIVSVLARAHFVYIIECRTPESRYALMRRHFEKIISGFRPLPRMTRPIEKPLHGAGTK